MLTALLVIPLLGSVAIMLTQNETRMKEIALSSALANFGLSMLIWVQFDSNAAQFQFVQEWNQLSFCHLHLGIDGLSLYFMLLTTFIMPICFLGSWDNITTHVRAFQIAFLVLESLLIAVFVVLDLMLFYICFESILIPLFLIIGIWGHNENRIRASLMMFLYTLFGSLFMLLAILVMYHSVGSTDYLVLSMVDFSPHIQRLLWLGFFLSLAIKVPMVPFHIWLPMAHAEAPLAGSMVLAGVVLKLSGYGFLRFSLPLFPEASVYFTPLVYALCIISIVYSALTTLRQVDLKRIIAYSSVSHMGLSILGVFSNTIQGIEGSILLMLAHGVVSPALFFLVTVLYDRYHTRILKYYRGLVLFMPLFATTLFIFSLANMAVPLSANFVGEFMTLMGAFQQSPILAILGAVGMILSAAYSIWLFNRISFGSENRYLAHTPDLTRREFAVLLPLLFVTILLGIVPNIVLECIHLAVSSLLL